MLSSFYSFTRLAEDEKLNYLIKISLLQIEDCDLQP